MNLFIFCGVAQRVRRSSDGRASACCTAGPSSHPCSTTHGGLVLSGDKSGPSANGCTLYTMNECLVRRNIANKHILKISAFCFLESTHSYSRKHVFLLVTKWLCNPNRGPSYKSLCNRERSPTLFRTHTVKKLSIFPSSRDVTLTLTKLSLGAKNIYMTSLFPPRESLISNIPAGDGNIENLSLRCRSQHPDKQETAP